MSFGRNRAASGFARLLTAAALCAAMSGCFGAPDLDSTEVAVVGDMTPERAAAVAEMRAQAAAGDKMRYPDAFQTQQTARLAARGEPLTVAEVEAVQTELASIAERRAVATDAREIALLEARARELRLLVLRTGSEQVRR
jgi:hypothetical protein